VVTPATGDEAMYRRTLRNVVEEVAALENGVVRKRIVINVTEECTYQRHEEPLPTLPTPKPPSA